MTDKTYNGWANWATWNMELWICNEEPIYRHKVQTIRRAAGLMEIDATIVQQFAAEWFPEGTPDMDSPKKLRDVDWDEIAEAWQAEAEEYASE